ncbi:MAG: hypothetical protein PVI21_06295 [Candidatus Woesebacteria bacterium]|jgi:hypothetical protein
MTKTLINRAKERKPSKTYIALFVFFAAMFVWRFSNVAWFSPISSHLSNFAITGLAILILIGPKDFSAKSKKTTLFGIVCFFISINIIVELLNIGDLSINNQVNIENINTADLADAMFGILAAIIVWTSYYKFTLRHKSNKPTQQF